MLPRSLLAALVAGLVAGCSPLPAWQRVELPEGVRPVSLAVLGDGVLVGGQQAEGPAPVMLQVRGARVTDLIQPEPAEPYAEVAEFSSVAVSGDAVYAIGRATGGAHGNIRWTVWDGSLAEHRITNRPQDFFTFGGHDAGPLLGTLMLADRPVIAGSHTMTSGSEGVLWTRTDDTWHKRTGIDPALASGPDRSLGFAAAAGLGSLALLAGAEVGLAGEVHQQPMLWSGSPTGPWHQAGLPLPAGLEPEPGQPSWATGVACPDAGTTCWVAGWARGRPLAWPVTVGGDGVLTAAEPTVLTGEAPDGAGPQALVAISAGRPAVLTNAADATLQRSCLGGWRTWPAPPGRATALVATEGRLYAVAGDGLWRLDAPRC